MGGKSRERRERRERKKERKRKEREEEEEELGEIFPPKIKAVSIFFPTLSFLSKKRRRNKGSPVSS